MAKEIYSDKADTQDTTGEASESLDDMIAEADSEDLEELEVPKKPGIGVKILNNRKIKGTAAFVKEEKKQLLATAIICCASAIVIAIACAISIAPTSFFKSQENEANKAYNALLNDIDVFKHTDPYFTKVDNSSVQNQNKDVNWIPVHGKLDEGRVMADKQIFWDWISPLFDSDGVQHPDDRNSTGGRGWLDGKLAGTPPSEALYNKRIDDFIKAQGIDPNHLFITTFLEYSNYMDTNIDRYKGWTYVIGSTDAGDYHYMALVPMATSRRADSYTMIGFTFTAKHEIAGDGSVNISIKDFNVWPPDTKRLTYVGRG